MHLIVGGQYLVSTPNAETERWFSRVLVQSQPALGSTHQSWWESARLTSPLGILVAVPDIGPEQDLRCPKITEVLFYAARDSTQSHAPPTPPESSPGDPDLVKASHQRLGVHALALSSDLIQVGSEPSPPVSPIPQSLDDAEPEGVLLPPHIAPIAEIINEPPVRKRKDLNDTFEEASERRKRARRKGGESVAAAAASNPAATLPSLKHRRSASAISGQAVPLQTRPLSRSPSITSSRPPTARPASIVPNRSSLSHVQTAVGAAEDASFDTKNKDLISRMVMAGMRLYGLSQSRTRKARAGSSTASPAIDISFDDQDEARRKDEEYRLVYHQVYKGCLLYTSPSPRDGLLSRMPSSA